MNKKKLTCLIVLLVAGAACFLPGLQHLNAAKPAAKTPTRNTTASAPSVPSPNWVINSHGECCEGNLAAAGDNTFVLLPVLLTGNIIEKSSDGGNNWAQKYPPAPASVPFGIEGDMQAYGTDVIFFGTELGVAITAHSDDFGETFIPVQNPLASAGNDQAWSYLGPFGDLRPGGPLPTDEPYVLTGWMRIGSVAVFSFDGGLTFPIQTPLVGADGSGSEHIVCQQNAHDPTFPGDTRIADQNFKNQKSGRYGAWGTDRKFYWAEPAIAGVVGGDQEIYVCKTDNFGGTWTGIKHPISPGPGQDFVVAHTAFDNNGTMYVLHGDKLYVSLNQGESFAFVHTLPRYGSARLSDPGSDQFFAVNCGTIHIALAEAAGTNTNMWYLRGSRVDTATPVWDEELVETVPNNRLDFIQMVVNGNNIPTMSYTKPSGAVTTASRMAPMPPNGPSSCAVSSPISVVSRKVHGSAGTYDIDLLPPAPGIECRTGGTSGDFQMVVTFPLPITFTGATVSSGTGSVNSSSASSNVVTVNLTGVTNAQYLTVTLNGVTDANGSGNVPVNMAVLLGDTNEDTSVNSADIGQTKSRSGTAVSSTNFRSDVTIDGNLNSADIGLVKSKSGTALP